METQEIVREETTVQPTRTARLRNRVAAVLAFLAALVAVPTAAFAQTSSPTLPDPSTVATSLANSAGSQLANTAVAVLPIVIGVLVLFWAINFVLKKTGMRGRAGVH